MFIEFKSKVLYFAVFACCVSFLIKKCCSERITYIAMERPQVTWFDKEYYSSVIFKSRRVSRTDPVYYVTVNYTSLKNMDNNFVMNLYFHELLSNVYKRSFVEFHVKLCDFVLHDAIIGVAFREAYYSVPEKERAMAVFKCPAVPGTYAYPNMRFRLPGILASFPFKEGRVYINVTDSGRTTGLGFIDFHIKTMVKSKK